MADGSIAPAGDVLIVDDNPANLRLLTFILTKPGHAVRTALSGAEALVAIAASRPRMILMDLQMPGISGLDLTRALKADPATRDIVIIAVTAYAMVGDEAKALAAGCDGYVSKPIDKARIRSIVAEHMAAPVRMDP